MRTLLGQSATDLFLKLRELLPVNDLSDTYVIDIYDNLKHFIGYL